MKKFFICLFLIVNVCFLKSAIASCNCAHHSAHGHSHNHAHHHSHNSSYSSSNSSSQPVYLVRTENDVKHENFPNCTKHYMITDITTNYYSDGSRRTYINSTVYNQDDSTIVSDCSKVNHIFYKKEHYFIICKNRGSCSIIDSFGSTVTKKGYSFIEELKENRFLVKYDKKYGIIDIKENSIVPVKYQKFQKINNGIFITKLNGYFGILDIENNILVKNDCEKIKPFNNTIIIKRYGKYGLCNLEGKILYNIEFDKIKKFGEYILIKKNKKYQILDEKGDLISDLKFEKVKLKRNTLYGLKDRKWIEIK